MNARCGHAARLALLKGFNADVEQTFCDYKVPHGYGDYGGGGDGVSRELRVASYEKRVAR